MKDVVGLLDYGLPVFQFLRNRAFLTDEACDIHIYIYIYMCVCVCVCVCVIGGNIRP
jgi:hypothetical protein